MSKTMKVRKVGSSLVFTITKDVAELFKIKEGSEIDIEPMGVDSFRVKVR